MPDLVLLAEQFVSLSAQLEATRNAMRLALANGGAGPIENPQSPAGSVGGEQLIRNLPRAQVKALSAQQDAQVIELLRSTPNLKTAAIAKTLQVRRGTTAQRLARLKERGAVTGGGSEGWSATA